jgi:hypothetical protein
VLNWEIIYQLHFFVVKIEIAYEPRGLEIIEAIKLGGSEY